MTGRRDRDQKPDRCASPNAAAAPTAINSKRDHPQGCLHRRAREMAAAPPAFLTPHLGGARLLADRHGERLEWVGAL